MLHTEVTLEHLHRTIKELDHLVVNQDAQIRDLRAKKNGLPALKESYVRQLAKAAHEIERGDVAFGVKLLSDVLGELDPRWRELV